MMVHATDAANHGYKTIMLKTVDMDVVVLATHVYSKLDLDAMWICFAVGEKTRFISIHDISHSLGPDKVAGLPLYHTFSGCNTVSGFCRIGTKTALSTWRKCNDIILHLSTSLSNQKL